MRTSPHCNPPHRPAVRPEVTLSAPKRYRWPALRGLAFGGDYNPEQWPEEVWAEDVRLMQEAGVTLVTVGVFSWAQLQPSEQEWTFGWLDRVLDTLHAGGIAVDLATATASPPPWFSSGHPESLPVTADGVRLSWGSRQAYCPSSTAYRTAATTMARRLAERYGQHPAVVMWHIGNEYGCHVAECFCDASAAAFRTWLQGRYGDLGALNSAWGTAFWSQRYSAWDEVIPPRASPTGRNPSQLLDWARFCSGALLELYLAERAVLDELTPELPVTTNYMAARFKPLDYREWSRHVDLVSNDHYAIGADPEPAIDLALGADLARSLGGGRPWLLMESSTSAVNWQPVNLAKEPGQMRREALAHVARGADGVMFFQWRASSAGAEKFHSALVPHAGTELDGAPTKVWSEVTALGAELAGLSDLLGTPVRARVALLWDYHSWWAGELQGQPSVEVQHLPAVRAIYAALWRAGVTVDLVHPEDDLGAYDVLLAPSSYLITDAGAAAVDARVRAGAHAVVWSPSGVVDEHDHIRLGGYPGAFRDLLGVVSEEVFPLLPGAEVRLSTGATGTLWSEWLHARDADVLASYTDGPLAGRPAITRSAAGAGTATYVTTRLDDASLADLLADVLRRAGVEPAAEAPPGVEVVRRGPALFVLNHTATAAQVAGHRVDAGDAVVLRDV